ncbi:MAG: Na+/H+ antiporter subunit E [Hyphomicrobiales bacterium]|nr:MAG: Na+/H+ antiporter subunit E [Hyphomicrobiales bacterium]
MNSLFLINILMAFAWAAVTGSFSLPNLIFGFALSALALSLIREQVGTVGYLGRARRVGSLIILFLYELVLSAFSVAKTVLKPRMNIKPAFVAYPLRVDKDFEITLLANLITLTPGTLSVDVSPDRQTLYIHAINVEDEEALKKDIAEGFEMKIMEAFR